MTRVERARRPANRHDRGVEWTIEHSCCVISPTQAEELQALVGDASRALGPPEMLEDISDHLFVMQETLHSLGVPYAFASHEDWWRILDDR